MVVIGYMGNNIFPFRIGELLRAYVLKRNEDVSISSSLATIVVERIFDGLTMLLFVFIALPTVPSLPDGLRYIVIVGGVLFLGALVVFLFLAAKPAARPACTIPSSIICCPNDMASNCAASSSASSWAWPRCATCGRSS